MRCVIFFKAVHNNVAQLVIKFCITQYATKRFQLASPVIFSVIEFENNLLLSKRRIFNSSWTKVSRNAFSKKFLSVMSSKYFAQMIWQLFKQIKFSCSIIVLWLIVIYQIEQFHKTDETLVIRSITTSGRATKLYKIVWSIPTALHNQILRFWRLMWVLWLSFEFNWYHLTWPQFVMPLFLRHNKFHKNICPIVNSLLWYI